MSRLLTLNHLLAPLSEVLHDPRTTEVVVNHPGQYGVEANGVWSWHEDESLTFDRLDAIGILAAYSSSQDLSPSNPMVAATLPGGERLQVCRPPATSSDILSLTIRKPSTTPALIDDDDFDGLFGEANSGKTRRSRSDDALVNLYHDKRWTEFFRLAVKSRKTIGACGSVGSGKTHFLRRMLMEIPSTERIVTIEDTAEFRDAGPANKVNLFYGRANLTSEGCLRAALRMRPDRIIVQEVRGPESFGWLRAIASGHPGSCTSWHADEGREFDALELMVRQHEAGRVIPETDLRRYLQQYIDVVVWLARDDTGFKAPRVWYKTAEDATS